MSHDDGDVFREVLEKASAYDTYGEAPIGAGDEPTTVVETTDEAKEPVSSEGRTTSSVTLINLFRTPDAHPVVLDLALLRKYNIDWLSWERETLELRISQDFRTPTSSNMVPIRTTTGSRSTSSSSALITGARDAPAAV